MSVAFRLMSVFLALGLLAAPAPAHAQNANGHAQAIQTIPGKFIQDLGDRVIAAIANKTINHEQRTDKFRGFLRDSFDLPTIGRFVIGRSWNAATPAQQKD